MARETTKLELVETHNLLLALQRLQANSPSYDSQRWKRALYHALGMAGASRGELEKLRLALELP